MPAPSVPYKVMPQGLTVRGSRDRGYSATVPCLVAWSDAFTFVDDIMGATAGSALPPAWTLPWVFPNAGNARLYAQDFEIRPCGSDGQPEPAHKGLVPGEYFTHAVISVQFGTPDFVQDQATEDPANAFQFDAADPVTLCTQTVRMSGKMVTRKSGSYVWDSDGTDVKGDFATPETETQLVLTFPRIPYLPWSQVRPYVGKVNLTTIFGCAKGTLLFEGTDIDFEPQSNGTYGMKAQVMLSYQHDGRDWNELPRPDGTYALVKRKGDASRRIYEYSEFHNLFA